MKLIDNFKKLEVSNVNDEDVNIDAHQNENTWIIKVEGIEYFIIRRNFLININIYFSILLNNKILFTIVITIANFTNIYRIYPLSIYFNIFIS